MFKWSHYFSIFCATVSCLFFYFLFKFEQILLLLLAGKSMILLLFPKASSSIYYCYKFPDVFYILLFFYILHSTKLYIAITISISWVSSTCVLFISVVQLVNGAQFLNITFFMSITYCRICSCCIWNCYSSFNKYVCITIVT